MLRESDICWLCGKPGADSIDHVVPVAKGGSDAISNLRPAHLWPCNQRKGSRVQVQATRNSREW
jgi:5-methylcytosine-specific restriction endonuclease McrA